MISHNAVYEQRHELLMVKAVLKSHARPCSTQGLGCTDSEVLRESDPQRGLDILRGLSARLCLAFILLQKTRQTGFEDRIFRYDLGMAAEPPSLLATTIFPAKNSAEFLRARDFLLVNRSHYAEAYENFRWPTPDHFHWAFDYFDILSAHNTEPALIIDTALLH